MRFSRVTFGFATLLAARVCLGAEFRNLGFDEADTTTLSQDGTGRSYGSRFGADAASQFLPGWSLYAGTNSYDEWIDVNPGIPVVHNAMDGLIVALYSPADYSWPGAFPDGIFALSLSRTLTNSPIMRLEQRGMISGGTRFMAYKTTMYGLEVEINNEVLSPVNQSKENPLFFGSGLKTNLLYDISKFAGQEVTLAFVGPFGPINALFPGRLDADGYLDSIRFVTAPPPLGIANSSNQVTVSWPASTRGLVLQTRSVFAPATNIWMDVRATPVVSGDRQSVTLSTTNFPASVFRLGLSCDYCGF